MPPIKDGDRCEICHAVYGTESTIRYKPVGASNFRFQCEGNNRDKNRGVHRFTSDGKLYRTTKRIHNAESCPVCGYFSGVTGDPKTGAGCHVCHATFKQRGKDVVLTGLGKFASPPDWFTGVIELEPKAG